MTFSSDVGRVQPPVGGSRGPRLHREVPPEQRQVLAQLRDEQRHRVGEDEPGLVQRFPAQGQTRGSLRRPLRQHGAGAQEDLGVPGRGYRGEVDELRHVPEGGDLQAEQEEPQHRSV